MEHYFWVGVPPKMQILITKIRVKKLLQIKTKTPIKKLVHPAQKKVLQARIQLQLIAPITPKNQVATVFQQKLKKSTNYVPHGDLTNKKQFSYDNFGTKLTLDKYKKTDQVIINRPLRYQISQTRLLKNEAKTAKAKKVVADAFNNTDISSTYYTLQLKYTVQNESNQMVIIGGLNYIKLSNDYAGTPISNMVDSVAGKKLAAGKKLNTNVVVLVPASLVHTLNSCTIQFSSAYSLSGKTLSKDSLDSKITF